MSGQSSFPTLTIEVIIRFYSLKCKKIVLMYLFPTNNNLLLLNAYQYAKLADMLNKQIKNYKQALQAWPTQSCLCKFYKFCNSTITSAPGHEYGYS